MAATATSQLMALMVPSTSVASPASRERSVDVPVVVVLGTSSTEASAMGPDLRSSPCHVLHHRARLQRVEGLVAAHHRERDRLGRRSARGLAVGQRTMIDRPDSMKWAYWIVYVVAVTNAVAAIASVVAANWPEATLHLVLVALTPVLVLRLNARHRELGSA